MRRYIVRFFEFFSEPLLLSLFVFIFYNYYNAYIYGDLVGDHQEQIPIILRFMDPKFLVGDWFIDSATNGFYIRSFYSYVMAQLAFLTSLPKAFFLVYLFSTILTILSIVGLLRKLTSSSLAALCGALLFTLRPGFWNIGGVINVDSALVPGVVAWPFALLALWAIVEGKIGVAIVAQLISLLFHPLIGTEMACILCFTLVYKDRQFSSYALVFLILGVLGGLSGYLGTHDIAADSKEIARIIAFVRHPWHYDSANWPVENKLRVFILLGIGFLSSFLIKKNRALEGVGICITLIFLVGLILVKFPILWSLLPFQVFRLSVLSSFWGLVMVVAGFAAIAFPSDLGISRKRLFVNRFALLSVCLSLFLSERSGAVFSLELGITSFLLGLFCVRKWILDIPDWVIFCFSVYFVHRGLSHYSGPVHFYSYRFLSFIGLLSIAGSSFMTAMKTMERYICIPLLVLLVITPFLTLDLPTVRWPQRLLAQLKVDSLGGDGLQEIRAWLEKNTPPAEPVITGPYHVGCRLGLNKPIIADFKSFPFKNSNVLEWYERIGDLLGQSQPSLGWEAMGQLSQGFHSLREDQLRKIALKYGAHYLLSLKGRFHLTFPIVVDNGTFQLYRIN